MFEKREKKVFICAGYQPNEQSGRDILQYGVETDCRRCAIYRDCGIRKGERVHFKINEDIKNYF